MSDNSNAGGDGAASAMAQVRAVGVRQECAELDAEVLMQGQREILILHRGERYRLRITSNEKLILTK